MMKMKIIFVLEALMSHSSAACPSRPLVEGPVCRIDRCGCGTMHLTIGALTLRLKPSAARELADALASAVDLSDEPFARDARPLC